MHQAAALYWNLIAQQQPLATEWARRIFPLRQEQMDLALEWEDRKMASLDVSSAVAAAYIKVMPLLWERKAISNFLLDNPTLRIAMPPQESVAEAVWTARLDYQMTTPELKKLAKLFRKKPI
jgi:hypothetical protein